MYVCTLPYCIHHLSESFGMWTQRNAIACAPLLGWACPHVLSASPWNICVPWGNPRTQCRFYGKKTWKHNEAQWSTMKHDETQWNTMKHNEAQWSTMKHNETQWNTMKHNETLWNTMKHNETQWNTMKHNETSNTMTYRHVLMEDGTKHEQDPNIPWIPLLLPGVQQRYKPFKWGCEPRAHRAVKAPRPKSARAKFCPVAMRPVS